MKAHCYRERARAADGENRSSKNGIEKRLYPPFAKMSFYPLCGNKLVDQAAQEEPYCKEGQYLDEIILKYEGKLGYQLLTSLGVIIGILKLWLIEEPPCLSTEPYQKEHKGDFREHTNNCSQRCS